MSAPQGPQQQPYGQQQPYQHPGQPPQVVYVQQQGKQRSVAGTTAKVILTLVGIFVGLIVLVVVGFIVLAQLS